MLWINQHHSPSSLIGFLDYCFRADHVSHPYNCCRTVWEVDAQINACRKLPRQHRLWVPRLFARPLRKKQAPLQSKTAIEQCLKARPPRRWSTSDPVVDPFLILGTALARIATLCPLICAVRSRISGWRSRCERRVSSSSMVGTRTMGQYMPVPPVDSDQRPQEHQHIDGRSSHDVPGN